MPTGSTVWVHKKWMVGRGFFFSGESRFSFHLVNFSLFFSLFLKGKISLQKEVKTGEKEKKKKVLVANEFM